MEVLITIYQVSEEYMDFVFLPTRRPTPEGRPSSWQIIEPYVSREEKSHLSVRDFF